MKFSLCTVKIIWAQIFCKWVFFSLWSMHKGWNTMLFYKALLHPCFIKFSFAYLVFNSLRSSWNSKHQRGCFLCTIRLILNLKVLTWLVVTALSSPLQWLVESLCLHNQQTTRWLLVLHAEGSALHIGLGIANFFLNFCLSLNKKKTAVPSLSFNTVEVVVRVNSL